MNSYAFYLFSHHNKRSFAVGDAVFVWLRSNRSTGRAVVLQTPAALPAHSEFAGRYQVQFSCTGQTAHVRPERLLPVYTESQSVLVTAATEDYRRLARSQVNSADVVIELGCSYGMCTNMLAEHAAAVIGIDNSEEVVAEARQRYPHVRFEVVDVLNKPAAVLDIAKSSRGGGNTGGIHSSTVSPAISAVATESSSTSDNSSSSSSSVSKCDVVFADIGGNRQLEALLRLLPWVLQQLQPRLLVVKSEELAQAAAQQLQVQQQQQQHRQRQQVQQQQHEWTGPQAPREGQAKQQQSAACTQPCSCPDAERQQQPDPKQRQPQQLLHNQVQQVQSQLQAAFVLGAQCNGSGSYKRQQPARACSHEREQHLQPQRHEQEQHVQQCAADHSVPQLATAALDLESSGEILNPQSWWDQLEVQCGLNPLLHTGRAEPWFVAARAKGFARNPLRYPQRFTADGVRICRPHNYDRCFKINSGCEFDHVHCHHCGAAGHRAVECPVLT